MGMRSYSSITLKGIHFDFVSCITETTKARLISQGVDIRKAIIHYKGIPIEQFPLKKNPGNLSTPIRLLYVGRLHPQKGLNAMVKAFCLAVKMNKHPLSLTLVGAGNDSYCHELKQIAELENVEINFVGFVAYDQLSSIYCAHDIFIFPSNQLEAQGSTYLEAMSSGLPVISTNQGGHGEILKHRKNALIFPQDDINMLAEQIMILIEDRSLRLKLITQARKVVENHFNFAVTSQTLENFLEQALTQSFG
jgi:glycosyltransferase involved in cell wall biosynthesis